MGPDQDNLRATSEVDKSGNPSNSIKEQSTINKTLTNNVNEEEGTVSTANYSYIIGNNNTVENNITDKVIDEAMFDKAFDFNPILGRGVIGSLDRSRMVVSM